MSVHPYASKAYAEAFGAPYEPLRLQDTGTYVLKRPIAGTTHFDAMGCYPLTPLPGGLAATDAEALMAAGIVSLVLVSDPFFAPDAGTLAKGFTFAKPYKDHYVHAFGKGEFSKHHRYEIRRAEKNMEVKPIALADSIEAWMALYDTLIEKRGITGIQAFSADYFRKLAALKPVTFGAFHEERLISAHIWLEHEGHVYSHLASSSEEGYKLNASYVVMDRSLKFFEEAGAKLVDLGAAPDQGGSKLGFFKEGFSNATMPCYLCGKILDPKTYDALSAGKNTPFFPAYR